MSESKEGSNFAALYEAVTRDIRVIAEPAFLEDQSEPVSDQYIWAYHIRIENHGGETVQLRHRYWHITDQRGQIQEVEGVGVVGEQPVLAPGDAFEYTSGCPLNTPSGIMVGRYEFETSAGDRFEVAIPAFSLDSPYEAHRLH